MNAQLNRDGYVRADARRELYGNENDDENVDGSNSCDADKHGLTQTIHTHPDRSSPHIQSPSAIDSH